jgi:hypothetical protein
MVNELKSHFNNALIYNDRKERIEYHGDIILNLEYWDCDCDDNYIHPITKQFCKKCSSEQEDHPNSREDEVRKFFDKISQIK